MVKQRTNDRFSIIPEWVLDSGVSAGAIHAYAVFARYTDKEGRCFPRRRILAKRMGCSLSSLDRAKQELIDVGALVQEAHFVGGRQTTNRYLLLRARPEKRGSTAGEGAPQQRAGGAAGKSNQEREPDNEKQKTKREDESPASRGELSEAGERQITAFSSSEESSSASGTPVKDTWLSFLGECDSAHDKGIISPVKVPRAYAIKAARNRSRPPAGVDIQSLIEWAIVVKRATSLEYVYLPPIPELRDTSIHLQHIKRRLGDQWPTMLEALNSEAFFNISHIPEMVVAESLNGNGFFNDWLCERFKDPREVIPEKKALAQAESNLELKRPARAKSVLAQGRSNPDSNQVARALSALTKQRKSESKQAEWALSELTKEQRKSESKRSARAKSALTKEQRNSKSKRTAREKAQMSADALSKLTPPGEIKNA